MKRTFVAIKINPTAELLSRIYYLKRNLSESNINWIKENHFHITLRFIGDTVEKEIENIGSALENELSTFKKFDINLKGISVFGSKHSPKVIWVGTEPIEVLSDLADKINRQLIPFGYQKDRQNYVPHLTLARIRKLKDKDHFHKVIASSEQEFIQCETVKKVIFYESILRPSGAVYNVLKEVVLQD